MPRITLYILILFSTWNIAYGSNYFLSGSEISESSKSSKSTMSMNVDVGKEFFPEMLTIKGGLGLISPSQVIRPGWQLRGGLELGKDYGIGIYPRLNFIHLSNRENTLYNSCQVDYFLFPDLFTTIQKEKNFSNMRLQIAFGVDLLDIKGINMHFTGSWPL